MGEEGRRKVAASLKCFNENASWQSEKENRTVADAVDFFLRSLSVFVLLFSKGSDSWENLIQIAQLR